MCLQIFNISILPPLFIEHLSVHDSLNTTKKFKPFGHFNHEILLNRRPLFPLIPIETLLPHFNETISNAFSNIIVLSNFPIHSGLCCHLAPPKLVFELVPLFDSPWFLVSSLVISFLIEFAEIVSLFDRHFFRETIFFLRRMIFTWTRDGRFCHLTTGKSRRTCCAPIVRNGWFYRK